MKKARNILALAIVVALLAVACDGGISVKMNIPAGLQGTYENESEVLEIKSDRILSNGMDLMKTMKEVFGAQLADFEETSISDTRYTFSVRLEGNGVLVFETMSFSLSGDTLTVSLSIASNVGSDTQTATYTRVK